MANYPPKLQEYLDDFAFITSREERVEYLIAIADEFLPVPAAVAAKPYDEAHRVIGCESEAFVWAIDRADGTLDYYFDVLNPQGLSAMAKVLFAFFVKGISMGKGRGLTELVNAVVYHAGQRLKSM
ncbi:MAG: SufE family protein [Chloroflexi bacterium]|nr:SufE family protein [Chloroflexota bacterium]